ncbi:hypothetical protein [Lactococcus sp. DD01]|uniref:hypothetical protein n=1 Tax=Lactococcus sp. DD01 TaxID=1776443 RepID=UPI0007767370|nr:hypothetical protein [Lactococcus sp. DD01]KXT59256.1 hypothetical protein LACDD01_02171 [Lactococcus sp. DD01]
MSNLINIIIIITVISVQTIFGKLGNRYLGAILPLAFAGAVLYFLFTGKLEFSFQDIVMPFIGEITLIGIYAVAEDSRKSKLKKQLDKMKAKDISKK